jgi:hypothetical protein
MRKYGNVRIFGGEGRPIQTFAHSTPTLAYPCYPKEIRLGDAVASKVYCEMDPTRTVNVPWPYGPGYDNMGHFAHRIWAVALVGRYLAR